MAQYGKFYSTAYLDTSGAKIPANAAVGQIRVQYDEFTVSAALGANEEIFVGKLPSGARVVDAILSFPDLGTTGVVSLGYKYEKTDLVSDDNAFLDAVDVASAADTIRMTDQVNMVGFGLVLQGKADIVLKVSTATTATAGVIKCLVQYVTD